MDANLNLAFSALIAEQLEDLNDRLDSQPEPEASAATLRMHESNS
jgi:hypothetical protein